jgi:dihydrofolate reductase
MLVNKYSNYRLIGGRVKMKIAGIVAMSENRVIGNDNQLPWHLPADLKHFKTITMGKPILMGRKTFESIGRALPGRCNVIITRDESFQAPGCVIANSIETALSAVSYSEEIFIIGGAALFQQMLPMIKRLYITLIHHYFMGDVYLPNINEAEWHETHREDCQPNSENPYSYSFITLDRVV